MKTKLPSSSISSPKRFVKCHGILSFLFILFVTVSSFGQGLGITFECGANSITFGEFDGRDVNGFPYWTNGSDGEDSTTDTYTLQVEAASSSDPSLVWSVYGPDEGYFRYFYLPVTESFCSSSSSWLFDNGLSCSSFSVTCTPDPDSDEDGDGFSASIDCNDNDASIYPGATEICDGIDNNCNGDVDEGLEDQDCFEYEYCGDTDKQNKIIICHNGKDICVSINAIDAHLAHGDSLNSCSSKSANNGKGEKGEEIPTNYDVAFWPNPSNSYFNVKLITPNITEKVSIEAYDINGRLMHSNIINGNENYQFGNNLSSGIYIVKLTQESTTKMIKVVKQ